MEPIGKDKLKGHYVSFQDKIGKFRTEKVVRIAGRTLTVKNCLGRRMRINLDFVRGCIHHKNKLRAIGV